MEYRTQTYGWMASRWCLPELFSWKDSLPRPQLRPFCLDSAPAVSMQLIIIMYWSEKKTLTSLDRPKNRSDLAGSQQTRKFKKVQAKKLVKSNKSNFFFVKLHFSQFKNWFLAPFDIAKNGFWSKNVFVKLIYLIPRVLWPRLF